MKITVGVDISIREIQSILVDAFEISIGYWAFVKGYEEPHDLQYQLFPDNVVKYADYPVNTGGAVIVAEYDEGVEIDEHWLNMNAIQKGLQLMAKNYPLNFCDILNGTYDAEDADMLVQLAVLGEVRYS